MTIRTILAAAIIAVPTLAGAQTAADNYSYKAPSGMFSEGTTKWQMYQFMAADAERIAAASRGEPSATGTLSTSSSNAQSYPRPGETATGERRPTQR